MEPEARQRRDPVRRRRARAARARRSRRHPSPPRPPARVERLLVLALPVPVVGAVDDHRAGGDSTFHAASSRRDRVPDNPRMGPMDAAGRAGGGWCSRSQPARSSLADQDQRKPPRQSAAAGLPRLQGDGGCALGRRPDRLEPGRLAGPKDPRSGKYMKRIRKLGGNRSLHPDFGGGRRLRDPVQRRARERAAGRRDHGDDGYPDESDFGPAPRGPTRRSADAPVEGGYATATSSSSSRAPCDLFEMYRAVLAAGPGHVGGRLDRAASTSPRPSRAPRPGRQPTPRGCRSSPGWCATSEVAAGSVQHAIRGHLRRDPPRLHPPRDPLRLGPLRRDLPPMGLRLRLRGLLPRRSPGRLRRGQPGAADLRGALPLRDDRRRQRLELVLHRRRRPGAGTTTTSARSRTSPGSAFVVVGRAGERVPIAVPRLAGAERRRQRRRRGRGGAAPSAAAS